MSYDASNIIQVNTAISATGLSSANFSSAVLFINNTEASGKINDDETKIYSSLKELSVDFGSSTEAYKAAEVWFGSVPTPKELILYACEDRDPDDGGTNTVDLSTILDKARNNFWWYFTFFTKEVYEEVSDVLDVAAWADANDSMFVNCVTGTLLDAVQDANITNDICTQLTTLGVRHCFSFGSAASPYAGISLCAQYAAVDYNVQNSTITGEFKKLSVAPDDLTSSKYNAMKKDTKKCAFYTVVDLQGSVDSGRVINSISHSSYNEFIDSVINLDAFVNSLKSTLYNVLIKQPSKLPQTTKGQQILISAASNVGIDYILNGYLGERVYLDPDDGEEKLTSGFEILTKPEDILTLNDADRAARKSAPIKMRIFEAGAIHSANVFVEVF